MSLVVKNPIFSASDLFRNNPICTATEDWGFEISDLEMSDGSIK